MLFEGRTETQFQAFSWIWVSMLLDHRNNLMTKCTVVRFFSCLHPWMISSKGEHFVAKVIVGLSMSLDGFINDRNGSVAELYPDMDEMHETQSLQDMIRNTGAVVMGRHAFAMGDPDEYADTYEFQVPIFVLTTDPPLKQPKQNRALRFTFVTDGIESAIQQARSSAGDKDVVVIGGASTIRQCLKAGLVDEIQIDLMPVLLGQGLRLFEDICEEPIHLEKMDVMQSRVRTTLIFRILK